MAMAVVWVVMVAASVVCGITGGNMAEVSAAALEGAKAAVELCISLAGVLCLWSGFMELLKQCGLEKKLAALFRPLLRRLLPGASRDPETMAAGSGELSGQPPGAWEAGPPPGHPGRRCHGLGARGRASNELCRLVVLNTASVQLLPTTVAAVRAGCGAAAPFDILPAVWISSVLSVSVGLLAARLLERVVR